MRHFLSIAQLTKYEIENLIARALFFKQQNTYPCFKEHTLATLFYENSTRTRISFELAAQKLSIPTVHVDTQRSSEAKGEIVADTLNTLAAMGIDLLVVRHAQNDLPKEMAAVVRNAHIINAGDGIYNHPSQALLDLMTIIENKPDIKNLKIAIIGNIKHSRVAYSLQQIFLKMGVKKLQLIAPAVWQPTQAIAEVTANLEEGLADADVVVCLRVQNERLQPNEWVDTEFYQSNFALTPKTIGFAKPDAMIMHPGPINRGMEIESEVADGLQSFIIKQVKNGVYMRMAIIEFLLNHGKNSGGGSPLN